MECVHVYAYRYVHVSTYGSCNQYWSPSSLKAVQGSLTIALTPITMNTCRWVALRIEVVIKSIAALLGLHKNQGQSIVTGGIEQVEQEGPFVTFFNPHDLLSNVLTG